MSKEFGFNKLLCLVFKISFSALRFIEKDNEKFDSWTQAKSDLNYRMNRAVLKYLGRRGFCGVDGFEQKQESQFVLDAISELISQHFTQRCKIYRLTKIRGVPNERLFILASLISVYFFELARFLTCFRNLGIRFDLSGARGSEPVCLAINFPAHSFSIPYQQHANNAELAKPFSSFGEFLLDYESINGKREVLSVEEYTRRSKAAENQVKAQIECFEKPVKTFPRFVTQKSRSMLAFILDLRALLGWAFRQKFAFLRNAEALLDVKQLNKFTKSIRYAKLISDLESMEKRVESIFISPFCSLGYLDYDSTVCEKTINYNYGDNFFIPPSRQTQKIKNHNGPFEIKAVLSEASLSSLQLSGRVVGFTDIFHFLDITRKAINDKYGCSLPSGIMEKVKQRSAVLGYEIEDLKLEVKGYKNIAVFDVAPDENEHQLSRALIGDRASDLKFVEGFLLDIADIAFKSNCRILFKPKYSLSNYSVEYQSLIELIKKRLAGQFMFISPYTRMGAVIEAVEVCLSFPYTSTRAIGEEFGRYSFYYVPECYRAEFETGSLNSNLLIGQTELNNQLSSKH